MILLFSRWQKVNGRLQIPIIHGARSLDGSHKKVLSNGRKFCKKLRHDHISVVKEDVS
jgi:hypothetical protein